MRLPLLLVLLSTGCLPDAPSPAPQPAPTPAQPAKTNPLLSLGESLPPDHLDAGVTNLARPAATPDLAGLVNCFGYTACDPNTTLCIKYLDGTPAQPGAASLRPSCYQPNSDCPNGVFDCACIQQDPSLALKCGTCVDNTDRTFTCFE